MIMGLCCLYALIAAFVFAGCRHEDDCGRFLCLPRNRQQWLQVAVRSLGQVVIAVFFVLWAILPDNSRYLGSTSHWFLVPPVLLVIASVAVLRFNTRLGIRGLAIAGVGVALYLGVLPLIAKASVRY